MFLSTRAMPAMASGVRSSSVVSQMVDSVPGLGVDRGLMDIDWLMRDWSSHAGSTGETSCFVLPRRRSLLLSSLIWFLLPDALAPRLPCAPSPQSSDNHETRGIYSWNMGASEPHRQLQQAELLTRPPVRHAMSS